MSGDPPVADWLLRGTRESLDRQAAEAIGAELAEVATERGRAVLGVVGGRSVAGVFEHLAALELPWRKIHIVMADERMCDLASAESNWQVVEPTLVNPLLQSGRLLPEHTHPFVWDPEAEDGGVARYSRQLAAVGGRIDVAVLSAGEDGHTASLFPHHASILTSGVPYLLVEGAPKPPARRLSASRTLLEGAGLAVLMIYGEGKRHALEMLGDPQIPLVACPSKIVRRCRRGLAFTDL